MRIVRLSNLVRISLKDRDFSIGGISSFQYEIHHYNNNNNKNNYI